MPALETVTGVPIARVGVWETSTGRWVCTAEQLADAVRASRDPAFRKGVLKIGHTDPRFDGEPAVGRLENYRIDASGEVLLADLVGVPAWLAEILNSAYPSRSVEASLGVVTAAGNAYALVITGLALLGETPPAIESLADVAALYEQPTDLDTWVAAARVAASITKDGTAMPEITVPDRKRMPVLASATIDELVSQATTYAAANGVEYPWVREVYTDRVILSSDAPPLGRLWELEWAASGDSLTFTGPFPVKIEYTRLAAGPVAAAAHKTIVPLHYVRGRGDVSASTPEEQSPVSDLAAQVRERLGLPPDADDDAVTAALDERLGTGGQPGTQPPQPPQTGGQATGPTPAADQPQPAADSGGTNANQPTPGDGQVSASSLERLVAERVAAAVQPFRDQLAQTSRELAERKERERVTARDALLASAVQAGKITPADRAKWTELYDKSPDSAAAVEQVFASLAAGSAVPTAPTAGAHTGGDEPAAGGFTDAEYAALFPDEQRKAGV